MHRIANLILLSLVVAAEVRASAPALAPPSSRPTAADDCPAVSFALEATRWAEPKIVVAPEYPRAELAAGRSGVVDLVAHVSMAGRIASIHQMTSEPPNRAFEKAVDAVVKYWIFSPQTDCECMPVGSDVKLRVWFEIRDGAPVISVSSPARNRERQATGPTLKNRDALSGRLRNSYPRDARRAGEGGDVYAAVHVNPESGQVQRVEIKWVRSEHSFRGKFAAAVSEAFAGVEYALPALDKGAQPLACVAVNFRIGN